MRNMRRNEYAVKVVGVLSNRKVQSTYSIEIPTGHCCPYRERNTKTLKKSRRSERVKSQYFFATFILGFLSIVRILLDSA